MEDGLTHRWTVNPDGSGVDLVGDQSAFVVFRRATPEHEPPPPPPESTGPPLPGFLIWYERTENRSTMHYQDIVSERDGGLDFAMTRVRGFLETGWTVRIEPIDVSKVRG
jgi:hypothetical protein